jgi:DNA repair protein RadC
MSTESKRPHYLEHRKRVREKFRKNGLEAFQDYEALELLLTFARPRQDVKEPAKELIDRFGSFKDVLDVSEEDLATVEGIGPISAIMIRFVKEAAARYLQQRSRTRFSPAGREALIEYCIVSMGAEPDEKFRVICLDSSFAIVGEENVAEGTVDQATVYPRKVLEIALAARATTLVFVHNHPNGNVTPSEFDKTLTRSLVLAAKTMGISVYDHIIVSKDDHFSFRENGLL